MPPPSRPIRTLLSWSSGKDSAWALHVLRRQPDVEVVGLLTTFDEVAGSVAMHGVRPALVEAQAEAAGLPLWPVFLPWPCSNADYEVRMAAALAQASTADPTHVAFGDLFLEDVRAYREHQVESVGLKALFPLWHPPGGTAVLARSMVAAGVRGVVTCIDPTQLDARFAGRSFDAELLDDLPPTCDPCGERGEFHTFCNAGPMFRAPVPVAPTGTAQRDGFWRTELVPGSY